MSALFLLLFFKQQVQNRHNSEVSNSLPLGTYYKVKNNCPLPCNIDISRLTNKPKRRERRERRKVGGKNESE